MPPRDDPRPLVLITGAAGGVGSALADALADDYTVVGLDREGKTADIPLFSADLGRQDSIDRALDQMAARFGTRIASVIHLAAYFDFTGEENPLYDEVNVQGTRRLLDALQRFEVEQFVYSGTMLVHRAGALGERIDESTPIEPAWAYPNSKAAAEETIRARHGRIPFVLLHLAGVYDEMRAVPTLAHQIARIHQRDLQSHLYSGDPQAGQSLLHADDMVDAFRRTVDRRGNLPPDAVILIGEPEAMGYDELQDEIGRLIHGEAEWTTLRLPKPIAQAGAALQQAVEPLVPDAIDHGEKPFIKPFMVRMADDHYALDIARARTLLGWEPRHRIRRALAALVESLRRDPLAWYAANGLTPPPWMDAAQAQGEAPRDIRIRHEAQFRGEHRQYVWAHFFNLALGLWLVVSPPMLGLESRAMGVSDIAAGVLLMVFAALSLSWRFAWARWVCAAIGTWLLFAPLVFYAPTAAGYLQDTLIGTLVIGFAVLVPPVPGVSPLAAVSGPAVPPGWSFNPSSWTQRLPIIVLAFVGLHVSRTLVAYQLGHVDGVWEPFFAGGYEGKNGTEEIITSSLSEAWPVPDAGLGAMTYLLEILTGVIGTRARWRTMPWLVLLFGLMIVPLGVVSVFFIIVQPVLIGTWCTLCLIGAAAMLAQIPYSLDELLATCQFLLRRKRAGRPLLRVLFFGDTDECGDTPAPDERAHEFDRSPWQVLRESASGGVALTWNLALSIAIGVWLMCTRLTLDAQGGMANADHVIGSLVITVSAIACAEIGRPLRFLNLLLGAALLVTPFVYGASGTATVASLLCGGVLMLLSVWRGPVTQRYGRWNRWIV